EVVQYHVGQEADLAVRPHDAIAAAEITGQSVRSRQLGDFAHVALVVRERGLAVVGMNEALDECLVGDFQFGGRNPEYLRGAGRIARGRYRRAARLRAPGRDPVAELGPVLCPDEEGFVLAARLL